MNIKRSQGFTLIELIVVIVILGILAATALPKFIDLGSDARKALLSGIEGSMRGANTMLYGKAAAAGVANNPTATISATSTISVDLVNGYAADGFQLNKVMDISGGNITKPTASGDNVFTVQTGCTVTYSAAGVGGSPGYAQAVGGC